MKTHIMDRHLWKHTGGKKNPEHAQGVEAEAAVNPLTSTVLVLIKTRCRENDCREERNTQSDTHMHAHTYTHAFPGVTAFRTQQQLVATSGELTHAGKKKKREMKNLNVSSMMHKWSMEIFLLLKIRVFQEFLEEN